MIHIIAILIKNSGKTYFLNYEYDFTNFSYFEKSTVKEFMKLAIRESINNFTDEFGRYITISDKKYYDKISLHILSDIEHKYFITMITDNKYPSLVCKEMLHTLLTDFLESKDKFFDDNKINIETLSKDYYIENIKLNEYIKKYQDYESYSKLHAVKKQLEDIHELMIHNIDLVLKRGESLEILIEKSNDLSKNSKKFYKHAKKINKCCSIL
jgi:synaptobrevin family protein YKT6